MKTNKELKQPFFASFLESQLKEEESQQVQGGGDPVITLITQDEAQTMKYPSDQEDGITKPANDMYQTMKYPSDGDDDVLTV